MALTVAPLQRYLPNGMEVCLERRTSAKLISAQAWVKVGSCDEQPGEYGIAHVLEHMLFKGTKEFPNPGEIARTVEIAGGDINAFTRQQETVYHITAPSAFANKAASMLVEILFNSLLPEDELKRELLVVLDEEKRMRDQPGSISSLNLFHALYAGTPLERPIIGSAEVIATLTRPQVVDFYSRWYAPNNIVFVMVGDFEPEEMFAHLLRITENVRPRGIAERARLRMHRSERIEKPAIVAKGQWQEARVQLGIPSPNLESNDAAAWFVFSSILGSGDTSRLTRFVHEAKGLVGAIQAGLFLPRQAHGIHVVSFYSESIKTIDALVAIIDEIRSLADSGPSPAEVERVVYSTLAAKIYDSENIETRASSIGFSLLTQAKLRFEEEYRERIQKVTAEEVRTVAKATLRALEQQNYTISAAITQESHLTAEQLAWTVRTSLPLPNGNNGKPAPERAFLTTTVSKHSPEVRQIILPLPGDRSLHVNIRENHDLPIASCILATQGGMVSEAASQSGVSYLAAQMLTRGNLRQTYQAMSEALEDRAATLIGFASHDNIGLQLCTLTEHITPLFRIFLDSFLAPTFAPDQWERVHSDTLLAIAASRDNPMHVLQEILNRRLFGDHPYGRSLSGDEKIVASLTNTDASHYWLKILMGKQFILSLAGSLQVEKLIEETIVAFERFYQNFPDSPTVASTVPPPLELNQISYARFGHQYLERNQVHFALGFRTVPIHDNRRLAFELASTILSGQGGRLFLDLRDARGLAYAVGADHQQFALGGSFVAYMATSPDNVQVALEGIKQHLRTLAENPPAEIELERARNILIAGRAMEAQHTSFQARQLMASDLFGLPFDNFLTFAERISTITPELVSNTVRHILESQEPVLVMVGPQGMWMPQAE